MDIDKLFKTIINKQDAQNKDIWDEIQELKSEYVHDWDPEEFDNIDEAYEEQGRGEAESSVLNALISAAENDFSHKLSNDDHCALFDKLAEYYELNTN